MEAAIQIGSKSMDTATLVEKLLQYRLLEKLVQETVIDSLIEEVACDQAVAYEDFCRKKQLQSEEQRQQWRKQAHFTPAQMMAEAVREYRLHRFKEDTWGDRLQTYFLQRKRQLDRVVYSMIRVKDADLAQELYFQLSDDGVNFSDIARQYSEGKEAQTGGLVGPVELSVPHPTLAKILQVSYEGQLWPPTRIGDWLIIVRFEKMVPAHLDEAMRQRLLHEQFQALLQEQMQANPVKLLANEQKPLIQSPAAPRSEAEQLEQAPQADELASQVAPLKTTEKSSLEAGALRA
jgi:hypothetical protein